MIIHNSTVFTVQINAAFKNIYKIVGFFFLYLLTFDRYRLVYIQHEKSVYNIFNI